MRFKNSSSGMQMAVYGTFAAFLVVFFACLNAQWPLVGHDYFYFFPRMLLGKWHFLAQGFAPFRYAAQLCGGFPVYGNPHDVFYSLPQILSLFMGLWTSIQLSIAAAMIAGYAGWVRFGRDIARLPGMWPHVLALVILSNGYIFMHVMAGHLSYHTLPLIGWLLWCVYDRSVDDRRTMLLKSAAVALLAAYILYAAGYFVLILAAMTAVCWLPLELLVSEEKSSVSLRRIARRIAWYGGASLLLCSSKIVAVFSLMRFLPRSVPFDRFPPDASGLAYVFRAFFLVPQGDFLFKGIDKWGVHEYSMYLSPLVLLGVLAYVWHLVSGRVKTSKSRAWWALAYVLVLLAAFASLATGHGLIAGIASRLPLFSSLRVTVRFLYVPAILLSILGVRGLSQVIAEQYRVLIVPVSGFITIIAFLAAYVPMLQANTLKLTLNYEQFSQQLAQSNYLNRAANEVKVLPAVMPTDLQVVLSGITSPGCYEPLLRDATFRRPLTDGPVDTVTDGAYNLYNPACLQYPDENNCMPGDRIAEEDAQNLQYFTNGMPVTWKLSMLQRAADLLSLALLVSFAGLLVWASRKKVAAHARRMWAWVVRQSEAAAASPLMQHPARWLEMLRKPSAGSAASFRKFLTIALLITGLAFVFTITTFKVLDRDFWWHITAGKLMAHSWALIRVEPFAWTRLGLPYVANHEWLAQVVLYLVWATGGSTGVILFRGFVIALCMFLLLRLDWKGMWMNIPLAIITAISLQPTSMERPQLFSFVIFTAFLVITLRMLAITQERALTVRERLRTLLAFLLLQIAWVNTHGGAAMLAFLFAGTLFLDALIGMLKASASMRIELQSRLKWAVLLGVVLAVGFFLSPTTYENAVYLWNLLNDRTIIYILEWQPREWNQYAWIVLPFWIIGIAAVVAGRRNIIASTVILLPLGYLSLKALRHESFFLLAVMGVTIFQLQVAPAWQNLQEWLLKRRVATVLLLVILLPLLSLYAHHRYDSFVRADRLAGFGTFDFGKGAADFLERENVQGRMFNTYGIGGYLIHRGSTSTGSGSQSRMVFIDGRNVDYGFAFMNETFLAGKDPVQWQKLTEKYDFSYAVVDYFANKDKKKDRIYYAEILENERAWPMVYYDDWVAIYLKDTPQNRPLIEKYRYSLITPANIEFKTVLNDVPREQWGQLAAELKRAADSDPRSIKARIELSKLFIRQNRLDEAHAMAQDAAIIRPSSAEPHAMFAAIFVAQAEWEKAADELVIMLEKAGRDYEDVDYGFVAEVFARAGRMREARKFARRAGVNVVEGGVAPVPAVQGTGGVLPPLTNMQSPQDVAGSGTTPDTGTGAPMINPAMDAIEFNDKALKFAEEGRNAEARENFEIAIMLNPSFAEAWNNLGTLSYFEGKTDEAREHFERAIKEWPEYDQAHFNLALLLAQAGEKEAATQHSYEAERLGKDVSQIRRLLEAQGQPKL